MIRSILILALIGAASAARSANQYVDNVLQTSLQNELRSLGLDPVPVNNFNVRFGSRSEGEAAFTYGNITGFARVHRKTDCTGPKLVRGELTINCTLSLYPLATNHRVTVRNGTVVSYGTTVGKVAETLVYVVIAGYPQNYLGSVKSFQVTRLGLVSPQFHGLSPAFNRYVSSLQTGYRTGVSNSLHDAVQNRFVYALGRALAFKPMPRQ